MSGTSNTLALGCTRDRTAYFRSVVPFAIVVLVEVGVLTFGALAVFRAPQHRLVALSCVCAVLALAAFILVAPLASRHLLLSGGVLVRFGAGLKSVRLTIPFEEIAAAVVAQERLASTHALGPYLDKRHRRLVAAFSDKGQVLIRLHQPREVRFGPGRRAAVGEVLINVDDPKRLLGAFAAPPAASSAAGAVPSAPPERSRAPRRGAVRVVARGLTRRYGDREAVHGVDLQLASGEIYGLLGCNGAGKTTTIRMLVGLLEPTEGTVLVRGVNVWASPVEARRATGFAPDAPLLYDRLTGREFLAFVAQLHGLPRAEARIRAGDLLEEVDLEEDADRACGTYSLGMKRRLAFAAALLHRPSFIVLDEPLSGLDPRSARRLKDRIRAVADGGAAVLLSTHDLTTAEELCDRIGVLHRGHVVAEGDARELRRMSATPSLEAAFLALTSEVAP